MEETILYIIGGIVALVFFLLFIIFIAFEKDTKAIIERAKKIDPTVKTLQEANYVLTKDLMQNIGNKDDIK